MKIMTLQALALALLGFIQSIASQECLANSSALNNIYPVNKEPFALPLTPLFSSGINSFAVTGDTSFSIQNSLTPGPSSSNTQYGDNLNTIICATAEFVDSNPSIQTGSTAYLAIAGDGSPDCYIVIFAVQTNGTIEQQQAGQFCAPPTYQQCFTLNFFNATTVWVNCLIQYSGYQQTTYYAVTSGMAWVQINKNILPQVALYGFSGNLQSRSFLYGIEVSANSTQYFYNVAYINGSLTTLVSYQLEIYSATFESWSFTQTSQNFTDLTGIYVSSSQVLFTLTLQNGLAVTNLNSFAINAIYKIAPGNSPLNYYFSLGVYELENYPVGSSYLVSVGNDDNIWYYIYSPTVYDIATAHLGAFQFLKVVPVDIIFKSQVALPNPLLYSLLTPQFLVVNQGEKTFIISGPYSDMKSVIGSIPFPNQQLTIDPINNILVVYTPSQLITYQIGYPLLLANFQSSVTTPQTNNSFPNQIGSGAITVTATHIGNTTCELNLNYVLLLNSNIQFPYPKLANSTVGQSKILTFPSALIERLSDLFQGPNLMSLCTVQVTNDLNNIVATTNTYQVQTLESQQYPSGSTIPPAFIQNFQLPSTQHYLQVAQGRTDLNIFFNLCQINVVGTSIANQCDPVGNYTQLKSQIMMLDISFNANISKWTLALTTNDSPSDIQILTSIDFTQWTTYVTQSLTNIGTGCVPLKYLFLQNDLYIVTSNPSTLQVLRILITTALLQSSVLQGLSPASIYINQQSFGSLLFVDNQVNLVVLKPIVNGNFLIVTTITYAQKASSVGIGLTKEGIYIAYISSDVKNQLVQFLPRTAIYQVNFAGTPSAVSLPTFDFKFGFPMVSSFTNNNFYVAISNNDQTSTNGGVVSFQATPSSQGTIYIAKQLGQDFSTMSSVNIGSIDSLTFLCLEDTINIAVLPNQLLVTQLQSMTNEYFSQQLLLCQIQSNLVVGSTLVQNLTFINQYESIVTQTPPFYNLSTRISNFTFEIYPPTFFSGHILKITAVQLMSTVPGQIYQIVQNLTLSRSVKHPNAFFVGPLLQTMAQNTTGAYQLDLNAFELWTTFPAGFTSCPVGFTDILSRFTVSVCNNGSQVTVVAYDHKQNTQQTQQLDSITNVIAGHDLNGFVFLWNTQQACLYAVNYTTGMDNNWALLTTVNLSGTVAFNAFNVSIGPNLTSYEKPVVGYSYLQDGFIQIQAILITVPFGLVVSSDDMTPNPNSSSDYNLSSIQVSLYAPNTLGINYLSVVPLEQYAAKEGPIQFIQIGIPSVANGLITLTSLVITQFENYRIQITLPLKPDGTITPLLTYQCVYGTYGNMSTIAGASSYEDIVVVPFNIGEVLTYGVYQWNNTQLKDTPQDNFCSNRATPVTLIGGLQYSVGRQEFPTFIKLLPNGQLAYFNQIDNNTGVAQLNAVTAFSFGGTDNVFDMVANNFWGSSSPVKVVALGQPELQPTYESGNNGGLWFGLTFFGLIILISTIGYLCSRSNDKAREEIQRLIEIN